MIKTFIKLHTPTKSNKKQLKYQQILDKQVTSRGK